VLLAAAFGILNEERSLTLPESAGGPVSTQETTLTKLPDVMTDGVTLIGMMGLHAEQADEDPVVMGQSVLRLARYLPKAAITSPHRLPGLKRTVSIASPPG
jgi:hypothetical protein